MRRTNRPELRKAGNIRHAFAHSSGEAVVIFDADFCPRPEFLRETIPYLMDPSVGIVQSPQCFRWCKEQTWVEKGAGTSQEFFYRLEQASMAPKWNQFMMTGVCVSLLGLFFRARCTFNRRMCCVSRFLFVHVSGPRSGAGTPEWLDVFGRLSWFIRVHR